MKIEKNVPIPAKGGRSKYPWGDFEVGDSLFAEVKSSSTLYICATGYCRSKELNWKWTASKEKNGFRIWRIK